MCVFLSIYYILYSVYYAFVRICLYVPCGHLLRKGCPLGSRLWCITVSLSFFHWYPGLGVVLGTISDLYTLTYTVVVVVVTVVMHFKWNTVFRF